MSKPKFTYSIQFLDGTNWITPYGFNQLSKGYAEGYFDCYTQQPGPRLACRVLRSDGELHLEASEKTEVSIGMIAGWPTPEQYEEAAQRALDKAADIRERTLR